MADPRHALGERAEAAAARWLERDGWTLLARRWRVAEGELDLVCLDPAHVIVGVEVRARRTNRNGSPLESIDRIHLGRLRAALGRYAATSRLHSRGLRIDLVSVAPAGDGRWRLVRHAGIDAW